MTYLLVRNRLKLKLFHLVPMFAIPVTLDYMKRDYYVKMFGKEYKELCDNQKVVQQIIKEKTSYVTFEQVLRFVMHLSMDKQFDQRKLLPISAD